MADFLWKDDYCPTPGLLEHFPPPRQLPAVWDDTKLKQRFVSRGSLHVLNKNTQKSFSPVSRWKHTRYPLQHRYMETWGELLGIPDCRMHMSHIFSWFDSWLRRCQVCKNRLENNDWVQEVTPTCYLCCLSVTTLINLEPAVTSPFHQPSGQLRRVEAQKQLLRLHPQESKSRRAHTHFSTQTQQKRIRVKPLVFNYIQSVCWFPFQPFNEGLINTRGSRWMYSSMIHHLLGKKK